MVEPVAIETAWRWIDDHARPLGAESVDLGAARGRIPLGSPLATSDVPATSCALEEGYAVSAEATVGAAPYNPISCRVAEAGAGALPRGAVARVGAGQPLPAGANAVLPCDAVEPEGDGRVSVLAAVADGAGVVIAACELRAGEPLWPAGRGRWPLRAAEIGLLAAAGTPRIDAIRRPRTRILAAGAPGALEVLGPMLHALVERDGGAVIDVARLEPKPVRAADLAAGADLVLVAGGAERRSGQGIDAIVADDVEIAIQGVALEPGRDTCLARHGGTILALLPGLPAACLWSYELVAGRALRCRGGRDPGLPFAARRLRTTRKIASPLGLSEVVPVRLDPAAPGAVIPFPHGPAPRLRDAAAADGFLLVPAASEGFPAGSELPVWLFGARAEGLCDHG
jgi:molybdopterin molybdotransferase